MCCRNDIRCLLSLLVLQKIKQEPKASYAYEDKAEFEKQWSVMDRNSSSEFTLRKKIILTLFVIPFPIMVWGVMTQGWWFPVMASAFLIFTIIIMFIAGMGRYGLERKVL